MESMTGYTFRANGLDLGFYVNGRLALGLISQIVEIDSNQIVTRTLEDRLQAIESVTNDYVDVTSMLDGQGRQISNLLDRVVALEKGGVSPTPTPSDQGDSGDSGSGNQSKPVDPSPVNPSISESQLNVVYATKGTSEAAERDYNNVTTADKENNASNTIIVHWNSDSEASYYKVYRRLVVVNNNVYSYGDYELLSTNIKQLSYTDNTSKTQGKTYQYAVERVSTSNTTSSKVDSNRITIPTTGTIAPCGKINSFIISYNLSMHRMDIAASKGENMVHYYVIRDGYVIGMATTSGQDVTFSDDQIEPSKTYTYRIIGVTNYGLWTYSNDVQITVPGDEVTLSIEVVGEAKVGDDYYIYNDRTYSYKIKVRATSSNAQALNQITDFYVKRNATDTAKRVVATYESDYCKVGVANYNDSLPHTVKTVTVQTGQLATSKKYTAVDPILYFWYPDPERSNTDDILANGNSTIFSDFSTISEYGEITNENVTVSQELLDSIFRDVPKITDDGGALFDGTAAYEVNNVRDREISGKIFGAHLYPVYKYREDLRLFIFVPKTNGIHNRYYIFRTIDKDDGEARYDENPFYGIRNDIEYGEVVGNVYNSYRVYISADRFSDKNRDITDGLVKFKGYAAETGAY